MSHSPISEAEVFALVNSTQDLIWSVGLNYRLRLTNEAFLGSIEKFSSKRLEIGDLVLHPAVFSEELIVFWKALYDEVLAGTPVVREFHTPAQPGFEESWLELSLSPILGPDGIDGVACFGKDVTVRKRLNTQLAKSEARYRNLVESLPDLIAEVDANCALVYVNRASGVFFGLEPQLCVGRSLLDFVHPSDHERTRRAFAYERQGAMPAQELQNRLVDSLGVTREVSWNLTVNTEAAERFVGYTGIARDLSGIRAKQRQLMDTQARFEGIVHSAMDAIVTIDERQNIVMFNPAAEAMFGYRAHQIQSRPLVTLIPQEQRAIHRQHVENFARSGLTNRTMGHLLETHGVRASGEVFPIEVSIAKFVSDGKAFFHAVVRDISARKNSESLQDSLNRRLGQTQKLEALGGLASGVAHDMNNVLAAISAIASVQIANPGEQTASRRAFETIAKSVERGRDMVKGLLTFVRNRPPTWARLNWNTLIAEQISLVEPLALTKATVHVDLAPDLPSIQGDSAALSNVLMNLCVNAIDALSESTGEKWVTVATRLEGTSVVVEVRDNGSGMSEAVQARALEPFFTTKASGLGTGLGLYLVSTIVASHGGTLTLDSRVGWGTAIRMTFPALAAPPRSERVWNALVVDDDDLVRESFEGLLVLLGCRTRGAASGEEALGALAAENEFSVVFLDMNMEGLGGPATLAKIRATSPRLRVVITTGLVDQKVLELVSQTENVQLLAKPASLQDLKTLLAGLEAL